MSRPVTKKEQYLAKAAGITSGTTPPAVTREEHFLKAIADGTGYKELPTAITREEQYLKAMTGAPIGNAFYVWHSSVKGGGTNGMPERVFITDDILENGYDLTAHLAYGTLYGGYHLLKDVTIDSEPYNGNNWTWSSAQTADGRSITPVAGQTYVVKEYPWGFWKLRHGYGTTGGVVVNVSCYCACDLQNELPDAGFYISQNCAPGVKKSLLSASRYVTLGGKKYYVKDWWGDYGFEDGWIVTFHIDSTRGYTLAQNDVLFVQPWFETADGVEVKAPCMSVIALRDRSLDAETGTKVITSDIASPYKPEEEPEEEVEEE